MNCPQCNTTLAPMARFCPNCGMIIASPAPSPQQTPGNEPGVPQPGHWEATQPLDIRSSQSQAATAKDHPPSPLHYYQPNTFPTGANMPPAAVRTLPTSQVTRKRNRSGCLIGCLTSIVLLLVILLAGWIFALRPYLHAMAEDQLNRAMDRAVQQIPPTVAVLPTRTLPIQENTFNNYLVLNLSPSSPIQNPDTRITADGVRVQFQLYGNTCAISMLPTLQQGRLVAGNVRVEGIVNLVMSAEELAPLLNKHLANAQTKLQRPLQAVEAKDKELDVVLGPPSVLPTPPSLPTP